MPGSEMRWDILVVAAATGALIGVLFQTPPIEGWVDSLSTQIWSGLPWVLLALLGAVIGFFAYRYGAKRSRSDSP